MKTIFTVLVVLTLTACGGSGGGSDSSQTPSGGDAVAPVADAKLDGYYQRDETSPLNVGANNASCRYLGAPSQFGGVPYTVFFVQGDTITSDANETFTLREIVKDQSDDKTVFTVKYRNVTCPSTCNCIRAYKKVVQ